MAPVCKYHKIWTDLRVGNITKFGNGTQFEMRKYLNVVNNLPTIWTGGHIEDQRGR